MNDLLTNPTSMETPLVSPSILVVDDAPDNLRLLLQVLMQHGYEVRPVREGQRAITAAQLDPPDLILLDIKMPGMDGYEVCKRLKADERTREIPVIFLTVLDDVVDVVRGFELGGVDYVTKPVRAGELLARIDNQVQLRSLQRHMAQQESFLRSIYDGIEAGISVIDVLKDNQFRIVDVNQTALRMSGLTREQVEGMDLRKLLPPETIARNHQICVEQGISITREESTDIGGEKVWWLNTHTPLFNEHGQVERLIGTGINITERKQAELQLAEKTKELSQALETLQSTQTELVRSAKMAALGNMVAGVAHEINTPVGTAITAASTLENATQAIASNITDGNLKRSSFESYLEVATECSQLILSNLHRAGDLVQSFKQVAVDQSSLQARTFALKLYLQEVITNLTPTIKQTPHRILLSGNSTITLHSYPGAIAQVVTNLVINSLTHAYPAPHKASTHKASTHKEKDQSSDQKSHQAGNPITGRLSGTLRINIHQQPNQVIVQYTDDGCGILPEHQNRIFEPFYTTARALGGSGLGLHLVYNLVTQKLQGTINIASTPGSGTTFTITLPQQLSNNSTI